MNRQRFVEELLPIHSADTRQNKAAPDAPWTPECVKKILCPHDKAVIDQLRNTTINVADSITFHDPYYDGTKWTTKEFTAGGTSSASEKRIGMLSGLSCTEAATTIYHEIRHQNQPAKWTQAQKEYDAYYSTEQWTIERGLPGDQNGTLRGKDQNGHVIASRGKVEALVQRDYSVPPKTTGPPPPHPVDHDAAGNTVLSDGTTRKPKSGDRYYDPNPPVVVNERVIPPGNAKTSPWNCP